MSNEKEALINKRLLTITVVLAVIAALAATGLLVNIFEHRAGGEEPVLQDGGAERQDRRPGEVGHELPHAVRPLPADQAGGGDKVRWRRGGAALADAGDLRPDGIALQDRGRSAAEDDVGRLRFSRISARTAATPTCWTTRRSPSARSSPSSRAPACIATPRCTGLPEAGRRRPDQGLREDEPDALRRGRKLVKHPVACIDCHDPKTMQLRITRPGFIEGIRALKARRA